MNKNIIFFFASLLTLGLSFISMPNAKETQDEVKSVAWYVANIQEARKQNQICHDNPQIKETPNCANSLHALEISFKGGN